MLNLFFRKRTPTALRFLVRPIYGRVDCELLKTRSAGGFFVSTSKARIRCLTLERLLRLDSFLRVS